MASGESPTYNYRPPARQEQPKLRTCSSRRARLFAGGTYFRARDPGLPGNNISVEIIELAPMNQQGQGGEAYCVITNQNLKFDENVIGATPKVLILSATYSDYWTITNLHTTPHTANYYSISLRIRNSLALGEPVVLPQPASFQFTAGRLFSDTGKLSVKIDEIAAQATSESIISITPRVRIYKLLAVSKSIPAETGSSGEAGGAPPPAPTTMWGWSIEDLRSRITANDPWVEMLERSGPTGVGALAIPNPNPTDYQDSGIDGLFLSAFSSTLLSGGDGLPANPATERTGPSRSLVHVNYGELQNGKLGEHNTVYEWFGDTASAGSWKPY